MIVKEQVTEKISGTCPVCDAVVFAGSDVEESEIICCPDCCSMLVVDGIQSGSMVLETAPQIEEDWGE